MARAPVTATAYRVTFLSPVHVGTEERLGQHDVVFLGGRLHRVAADRLLRELEREPQTRDRYLTGGLPQVTAWLQQADRLRRLALYGSPVPREPRPREDVRPFLADPLGRPYLPGTEVKGAVRTAVLWHLVASRPDRARLARTVGRRRNRRGEEEDERDRRSAGQWLEQTLLGAEPREDAFRLLRVTDSTAVPTAALRVYPVLVAARQRDGLRLMERPRTGHAPSSYTDRADRAVASFCECLDSKELHITVELDRFLLGKWGRDAAFLERWPEACNAFSRHVAQGEHAWWERGRSTAPPGLQPLAAVLTDFYAGLLRRLGGLSPGHAVLNLGWGGGWRTKTVAEAFGEGLVGQVVASYRLDRGSGSSPFPKTRKVAWLGGEHFAPLGWVLLEPQ
jgi:CRISPR-associated protein Csm5